MPATARVLLSAFLLSIAAALAGGVAQAQAPVPSDPVRGDVRFVVFGDFNGPYGATDYPPSVARTVRAIVDTWQPDLVLMPGDLVAGQDRSLPDDRFAAMWAAFDRVVAEPLRRAGIPYVPTMGNHDASSLRDADGRFVFAREREAARTYWTATRDAIGIDPLEGGDFPFRYAVRMGPILVVVIDASSATVDPGTMPWLARLLALPTARDAELRIAMGHLPLYPLTVGRDRPGEFLHDADALRAVLEGHGIDTYVSGHHAAYYPGRVGALELLFAGGVGGRRILGHDAPPRSAVTVVDVDLHPLRVRYASFDPSDMRPIPASELPDAVDGRGTTIRRSLRGHP